MPRTPVELRRWVEGLALPDGRVVGSPGHRRARAWLVERLVELGLEPYDGAHYELAYGRAGAGFANVVARLPGRAPLERRGRPVLIAAHHDTCGVQPGADDNAAAIVAALAAAEVLAREPLDCDLVLAFFDGEEPPHFLTPAMGSIRFYEDQRREDFRCAIVMDLVGHALAVPGLQDTLVVTGAESLAVLDARGATRSLFADLPEPDGLRLLPIRNAFIGDVSDHHVFRTHAAPYLFLTCGEWQHYHQPTDTPDRLDYQRIARTSSYLVTLARWLATLETCFDAQEVPESDQVARFVDVAGPTLAALGLAGRVRTGEDLRRVVEDLRRSLLDG